MNNPFELIDQRLSNIERLLSEILVNQQLKTETVADQEQEFSIKELAKYWKCHVQTIMKKKRDGELPFHQHGRKVFFKKSEIDALTANPIAKEATNG